MVQRRRPGGYEVGYSKPPRHGQFKPGQSDNPKGRPKGVNNLSTDVKDVLRKSLAVKIDGKPRRASTQLAALLRLSEKALNGDTRALRDVIELAIRFNNEEVADAVEETLPRDDQEILDAYYEHRSAQDRESAKAAPEKTKVKRIRSTRRDRGT